VSRPPMPLGVWPLDPLISEARVSVADAAGLLDRVINYLAEHDIPFDKRDGLIVLKLAFGTSVLSLEADTIRLRVEATEKGHLEQLRSVVASHIVEFAGDHPPPILWVGHESSGETFANFREVRLKARIDLAPHMRRLTFRGDDIARFVSDEDIHVRMYFPPTGSKSRNGHGRHPTVAPCGRSRNVGPRPAITPSDGSTPIPARSISISSSTIMPDRERPSRRTPSPEQFARSLDRSGAISGRHDGFFWPGMRPRFQRLRASWKVCRRQPPATLSSRSPTAGKKSFLPRLPGSQSPGCTATVLRRARQICWLAPFGPLTGRTIPMYLPGSHARRAPCGPSASICARREISLASDTLLWRTGTR
jgi:hypothetical protein